MAAAYLIMKRKPEINGPLSGSVRWPRLLWAGFFVVLLLQAVPFPAFLVNVLSPAAHRYRSLYGASSAAPNLMSFSIIPSLTFQKTLEILSYFIIGWLVFRTITQKRQIYRLLYVLLAMGIFQAFYGLYELLNNNPRLLFYKKIHNLDSVTGTFVNRNHLSAYLEMIIPLAIGLVMARTDLFSFPRISWRQRIVRLSEKGLSINLLIGLGILLMAVAIVFAKSRSGVFVLVIIFLLFFGLVGLFSQLSSAQKKGINSFLKALFFLIVFLAVGFGIDATLKRFALDNLLHEPRPIYWSYAVRTFAQYPLLGTGLGTFGALAPRLEGRSGPISIGHAHNDYLEYGSELGVFGFSLLLGGILAAILMSWRVWRSRHHPEVIGLALGGIVSLASLLLHSFTDFNLHIPANMLLFSVVLPLTMVTAFYRKESSPGKRR
jgi:O-antigen ligase